MCAYLMSYMPVYRSLVKERTPPTFGPFTCIGSMSVHELRMEFEN